MRLFKTFLLFGLWLVAAVAQAQPTRVWQRTFTPRYDGSYFRLLRLSGTRLVGMGTSSTYASFADTTVTGARLWFYTNNGDTVRTRLYLAGLRINSQMRDEPTGQFSAIARQASGHLLVSGYTSSGIRQGVAVAPTSFIGRLDTLGNLLWTRTFLINNDPTTGQHQLLGLPDGGALLTCDVAVPGVTAVGRAAAARFDSTGALVWQRTFGRAYSSFNRIVVLADGSYALAGYQSRPVPGQSYVLPDAWLLRITASGDTLSSRYFGGLNSNEGFSDVHPAPRGGLLMQGIIGAGQQPAATLQSWLMQLDSLGQVSWDYRLAAQPSTSLPNYNLRQCRLLVGGGVLLSGNRLFPGSGSQPMDRYLAVVQPVGTTGSQLVWQRITPLRPPMPEPNAVMDFSTAGELTFGGSFSPSGTTYYTMALTRLQLAERPYLPNLCQTPPQALLGYAPVPTGDSLRFVSLSGAGPQYAQLVRWRWDFGDGTRYDGPTPPPHRYTPGSPAGTAVRLTVTNNLSCVSTVVVFPLALGTAAQRALQAGLSLYPNPAAAGTATVRLPGLRPQPPVPAELLNALGQTVRRSSWPPAALAQGQALELAGLAAGIYTLRLRPQEGALVKRLVIQ